MVTKNPEIVVRQATLDDSTILSQFNMSMAEETEGRQLDQTTVNAGVKQLFRDSRQGFYLIGQSRHTQDYSIKIFTYSY